MAILHLSMVNDRRFNRYSLRIFKSHAKWISVLKIVLEIRILLTPTRLFAKISITKSTDESFLLIYLFEFVRFRMNCSWLGINGRLILSSALCHAIPSCMWSDWLPLWQTIRSISFVFVFFIILSHSACCCFLFWLFIVSFVINFTFQTGVYTVIRICRP